MRTVTDWSKARPLPLDKQRVILEQMADGRGSMAEAAKRLLKRLKE